MLSAALYGPLLRIYIYNIADRRSSHLYEQIAAGCTVVVQRQKKQSAGEEGYFFSEQIMIMVVNIFSRPM